MTLRGKLLLAQAPLAAALVVVGIVATSNIASLAVHSEAILKDNFRSVLAAQQMKESAERLQDLYLRRFIGFDPGALQAEAKQLRQRFDSQLRIQESNITEEPEVDATRRLREAWLQFQQGLDDLEAVVDADRAQSTYRTKVEPAFVALRQAADKVLSINQDAIVLKSDRARTVADRVRVLTLAAAIAAILIGSMVSTILTSQLLRPLGLLTRAVEHIGAGDFEARVDVSRADELAALGQTINAMAAHLSEYRRSTLGELLQAQQASQAAIDGLPDPVVVFDVTGRIANVNTAAETLLDLGNKGLGDLPAPLREMLERARSYVLSGKGPYVPKGFEEAVPITGTEGDRFLLPRATPVYAANGSISSATVVLQDVTRLRLVDDLRNDLVATVAHELRTPLTSLRMAIHMCLEQIAGPLTDRQGDLLYAAREDCERLQTMVDELLDLARIQSGRMELHPRSTTPGALLDAAAAAYRAHADEKGVTLQVSVLPGLGSVSADRDRVQLVLSNLISNALRHTPSGGSIELGARVEHGAIRFEVVDSGPGVPPDMRRHIFERFVRGAGDGSGAAGLGLAISKDVVEAHGGEIGVDDAQTGGARFWFTLPRSA